MQNDRLMNFSELSDAFEQNASRTAEKRDFTARVNAAMAVEVPKQNKDDPTIFRTKEEKLAALDQIVGEGLKDLDSSQMMALFSAYRDLAAFDKMISLYKSAENEDFKNAPMVCEQLAVAYRKVPRGSAGTDNEKLADKIWDYHASMDLSLKLIKDGYGNGVTYENIGRCLRYIANQTKMNDKTAESKRKNELLTDSVARLEEGFMTTLESSVGIQAVHGNIALGREDKAKETAKVVYLASLRDGAEESNDYFCVSTALQAACIAGEKENVTDHLFNRLRNSVRYRWELDDIARDMERISKAFPSDQIKKICEDLKGFQKAADEQVAQAGFDTGMVDIKGETENNRHLSADPKLRAVRDHSYSYRGCGSAFRGTSRVGGNMEYGGQLPDHTVSRKDLRLFTGLVKMTPAELGIEFKEEIPDVNMSVLMTSPLTDIKDPELFMTVVDKFVRQTFTTENFAGSGLHMENNALSKEVEGDSRYDATVKSVLRACGKKIGDEDSNIDTRTNISAIFALGMGDCRHHAQVKQIMFDMWQKQEMNMCLSDMYYSVFQGKTVDTKGPQAQKFFNVLDTELRTADVEVKMPVVMELKEKQEWKNGVAHTVYEDGKPVMVDKLYAPEMVDGRYHVDETGKLHTLEEHTLCWLMKKNREGELTEFGLRDAFYQDLHYDWGRRDVDVSEIKVTDGKPEIPAGYIPADKSSTGKPIPVSQKPAGYNKGKRDRVVSNSIGRDVCLVGVPLEGFATPADFLKMIKDRDGMADIMQAVLLKDPETKEGWTAWRETPKKKPSLQEMVGAYAERETDTDTSKKPAPLQKNLNEVNNANNTTPIFYKKMKDGVSK